MYTLTPADYSPFLGKGMFTEWPCICGRSIKLIPGIVNNEYCIDIWHKQFAVSRHYIMRHPANSAESWSRSILQFVNSLFRSPQTAGHYAGCKWVYA